MECRPLWSIYQCTISRCKMGKSLCMGRKQVGRSRGKSKGISHNGLVSVYSLLGFESGKSAPSNVARFGKIGRSQALENTERRKKDGRKATEVPWQAVENIQKVYATFVQFSDIYIVCKLWYNRCEQEEKCIGNMKILIR